MAKTYSVQTRRSLVKSITFRATVVITDLVVIYLITHRIDTTLTVTILTNLASTATYFIHERIWNRIEWGRSA